MRPVRRVVSIGESLWREKPETIRERKDRDVCHDVSRNSVPSLIPATHTAAKDNHQWTTKNGAPA